MNIGIDIDDTISNTYETAMPLAMGYIKNVLKLDVKLDYTKVIDHNYIRDGLGLKNDEDKLFWKKYYYEVLENVKPKQFAVEAIQKLRNQGHKIVIITARWDDNEISAYNVSKSWLDDNKIPYDKIIVGANKKAPIAKEEKIDVFIDDSVRNCEEVSSEGIKSYLFSTEVNEHYDMKKAVRVNSWKEIYDDIQKNN